MKLNTTFLIIVITFPAMCWAKCDPETIQFYLDKGFSQEQITKLCTHTSDSSAPSYQPYQKPVVIQQEGYVPGVSAEERKAINQLKGGLDARSVDVTDGHINYIARICINAGNTPDQDQRVKKCIDVAFSIARTDLRVLESGRGLILFGQKEITVASSDVKRKHVTANPWSAFSPDVRFALERKYESSQEGNTTSIPLRKGAETGQIVAALRTIAASTTARSTGQNQSEVARVLDDSYVPPSEEDYATSQPEPVVVEEKKKKKRWWNPFD